MERVNSYNPKPARGYTVISQAKLKVVLEASFCHSIYCEPISINYKTDHNKIRLYGMAEYGWENSLLTVEWLARMHQRLSTNSDSFRMSVKFRKLESSVGFKMNDDTSWQPTWSHLLHGEVVDEMMVMFIEGTVQRYTVALE